MLLRPRHNKRKIEAKQIMTFNYVWVTLDEELGKSFEYRSLVAFDEFDQAAIIRDSDHEDHSVFGSEAIGFNIELEADNFVENHALE